VRWAFSDHFNLTLLANLGASPLSGFAVPASGIIYSSEEFSDSDVKGGTLPAWSVAWFLES
jgi:hypothetical protein